MKTTIPFDSRYFIRFNMWSTVSDLQYSHLVEPKVPTQAGGNIELNIQNNNFLNHLYSELFIHELQHTLYSSSAYFYKLIVLTMVGIKYIITQKIPYKVMDFAVKLIKFPKSAFVYVNAYTSKSLIFGDSPCLITNQWKEVTYITCNSEKISSICLH